jgi:hypothetical protein
MDCEPKVVIYRITLLVSEFLVDLCKCECNRMNGSSLVSVTFIQIYMLFGFKIGHFHTSLQIRQISGRTKLVLSQIVAFTVKH